MKTNHPLAIWALVLGILSLYCLGIAAAVPAVICGYIARSQIRSEPNRFEGGGMATAGIIIGMLSIAINVLLAFAVFALIGLALMSAAFFS